MTLTPPTTSIRQSAGYVRRPSSPADFILVGATTRDPEEISPALRSRAQESSSML